MIQRANSDIRRFSPNEPRIDDMMTAVAEACLNAIEHGNRLDRNKPLTLELTANEEKFTFRV